MSVWRVWICILALFCSSAIAGATTLFPSDTLTITFTTSSPSCPSGPCDALLVNVTAFGSFGVTGITEQVFDGTTLLGTFVDPVFCCAAEFHSATSLSTQGPVVDFTAINNGTINGLITFQIGSGFLTWPDNPTAEIFLAHAVGGGTYLSGTGLTITSIGTPEPSTAQTILLGMALVLWGSFRKWNNGPARWH